MDGSNKRVRTFFPKLHYVMLFPYAFYLGYVLILWRDIGSDEQVVLITLTQAI